MTAGSNDEHKDAFVTLRGFSTINFWTDDVAAAAAWYAEFLGVMYNPHHVEVLASTRAA